MYLFRYANIESIKSQHCRAWSWGNRESSAQPADPTLSMRRIQRGKPLKRLDLQLQVVWKFGQSWAEVTSPRSQPLWGLPHASQCASTWKAPSNIKRWSTSIFFYTFVLFLILLPCIPSVLVLQRKNCIYRGHEVLINWSKLLNKCLHP